MSFMAVVDFLAAILAIVVAAAWVLVWVVALINKIRGVKYNNQPRPNDEPTLNTIAAPRRPRTMIIQAIFILPFPILAIAEGQPPGFVLGILAIMTLMVWFIGGVIANLLDWLRTRRLGSTRLGAVKGGSVAGHDALQSMSERDSLRRDAVFLGKTLEDVRSRRIGE